MASVARMPMMAMTIISSISVKPASCLFDLRTVCFPVDRLSSFRLDLFTPRDSFPQGLKPCTF
jgi:hypothetical protein